MSYDRKRYDYSVLASGLIDIGAKIHDLRYDKLKISGAQGVLFDSRAIEGDYSLVAFSLGVALNPNLPNMEEKMKGFAVGLGIGVAAFPKTLVYGIKRVLD